MSDMPADDETCAKCGQPIANHDIDQYSGRPTKCPVYRQDDPSPPRGDY